MSNFDTIKLMGKTHEFELFSNDKIKHMSSLPATPNRGWSKNKHANQAFFKRMSQAAP